MAIKFKHGGREWETDTPSEAINLRNQLEAWDRRAEESGEDVDWIPEQVWSPDRIHELMNEIGTQQKIFLYLLYSESSITSSEAKIRMRLGSETVLAGVVSGLSKQLRRLGLKTADLYSVEVNWSAKGKTRTFKLSHHFRWIAESELGWPDGIPAHDAKLRKQIAAPSQ